MPEALNTRQAILNRIRSAIGTDAVTAPETAYSQIARAYQQTASMDRASIRNTCIERLREYDAHVYEASGEAAIASVIADILGSRSHKTAAVAGDFPVHLLPAGFSWLYEQKATAEQLNSTSEAITGCEVAIAHTGTIILKNARTLTLLPDHLLCIVYESQIVETVPEAMARLGDHATAPLTFISGPSATADIEMTRIRGVHGPRFLDVIIVAD